MNSLSRLISVLSFLFLFGLLAFGAGLWSAHEKNAADHLFLQLSAALDAVSQLELEGLPPDLLRGLPPVAEVPDSRFSRLAPDGAAIVIGGGPGQFLDLCPPPGCLAVAFGRDGQPVRTWPLLAEQLAEGPALVENKFDYGGRNPAEDQSIGGLQFYENGDLLVSLLQRNTFPYGTGLARVRPDGSIAWRRRDYSHHWARMLPNGNALTPSYRVVEGELYRGKDQRVRPYILCDGKQYVDEINEIGPDGELLRTIPLLELMLESEQYRFLLARRTDVCDPLHLNYVDMATPEEAAGSDLVEPGDILASVRSLSAVVLVAADGKSVKHVFTGSFAVQHGAQFLADGDIVLFDNMGADREHVPSRILRIDPDTGVESVIFAPRDLSDASLLSQTSGDIALSPDGTRALVTYTTTAHMTEISLEDGSILTRYDHIHPDAEGAWRRFRLNTVIYNR